MKFEDDLSETSGTAWLNDTKFLQNIFCQENPSEQLLLLSMIIPFFLHQREGGAGSCGAFQIFMVPLSTYLGIEGSRCSNPNISNLFGIGKETVTQYQD